MSLLLFFSPPLVIARSSGQLNRLQVVESPPNQLTVQSEPNAVVVSSPANVLRVAES